MLRAANRMFMVTIASLSHHLQRSDVESGNGAPTAEEDLKVLRDRRHTERARTEERSGLMTLALGAYFFLLAFVLAHLEIQIEGPHGWAEKLPTRRWDGPGVRRWFGKPVTGYHLCLLTLLFLFLHVPQFYGGSWER